MPLSDNAELKLAQSSNENEEPSWPIPKIDSAEPTLALERTESDEPSVR